MIPLPAGPVTGTVSIISENGQAIDSANVKLIGNKFPQLKTPTGANMTITYNAGYNALPRKLERKGTMIREDRDCGCRDGRSQSFTHHHRAR
jgi:hypothetical protein